MPATNDELFPEVGILSLTAAAGEAVDFFEEVGVVVGLSLTVDDTVAEEDTAVGDELGVEAGEDTEVGG